MPVNENVFADNVADALINKGRVDAADRADVVASLNDEILRTYRDNIDAEIAANLAGTEPKTDLDLAQRIIRKMHNYGFHWVGTSPHGSAVQVLAFLLGEIWTEIDQKVPIEPPNYLSRG